MDQRQSLAPGVIVACCLAGPLFVATSALAMLHAELPRAIVISGRDLASFLMLLFPATFVGAFLAVLPTLIGAHAMRALAEHHEAARLPFAWTAAGALCGGALAFLFDLYIDAAHFAFGLIATSALCARICRFPLRWG